MFFHDLSSHFLGFPTFFHGFSSDVLRRLPRCPTSVMFRRWVHLSQPVGAVPSAWLWMMLLQGAKMWRFLLPTVLVVPLGRPEIGPSAPYSGAI